MVAATDYSIHAQLMKLVEVAYTGNSLASSAADRGCSDTLCIRVLDVEVVASVDTQLGQSVPAVFGHQEETCCFLFGDFQHLFNPASFKSGV